MKYFIDTEFIEGFYKPLFGKRRHFIDLISIGIKCEDGREYYAISTEFNPNHADDWVKNNVISKLPERNVDFYDSPRMKQDSLLYKTNKQIAYEVEHFLKPWNLMANSYNDYKSQPIDVYAYYADYDWVVFCSLLGRMIDLPEGFPMYCRDLKQMLDEKIDVEFINTGGLLNPDTGLPVLFEDVLNNIKQHPNYPKQENEHSALDDAKWNYEFYKFLASIAVK